MKSNKNNISIRPLKLLFTAAAFTAVLFLAQAGVFAITFSASVLAPNEDTQVKLNWSTESAAPYYKLLRHDDTNMTDAVIDTVNVNTDTVIDTYTNTGLAPGTNYYYTIKAYSDAAMTNEIQLQNNTCGIKTGDMIKPDIVTSKYNINSKSVTLTWTGSLATTGIDVLVDGVSQHIATTGSPISFAESSVSDTDVSYSIVTKDNAGHASASSDPVTVTTKDPPVVTALVSNGIVAISWNMPLSNGSDYSFNLERSKYNFTSTSWDGWTTVQTQVTGTSKTDTPAPGGTYRYRLVASEASDYTGYMISGTVNIPDTSLPSAPTNLTATNVSSTGITLNWMDNASNETGYHIERKSDSGSYTILASLQEGSTSYTDTGAGIQSGHTYAYRVCALNGLGSSSYSNEVAFTASSYAVPASLTVTPVSSSQLDLAWSYTVTGSYNTVIERRADGSGAWSVIYTTASGVLKYSDSGLLPNTQYFYRVRNSPGLGVTTASYPGDNTGIGAYTMLSGLSLSGYAATGNTIYLTWSGNTGNAEVTIERKMADGSFSDLAAVNSSTTGWYDNTGLISGASYTYRVMAKSGSNISTYSNEVTISNIIVEAPSGLTVSVNSNSGLDLSWTDNSSNETGFEIWRYTTGSGTYLLYATVGKNVVNYTDASVQSGAQYYYMVRAYMTSGGYYSGYSNSAGAGVGLINPATNLKYSCISGSQVNLTWTDNSSNEGGFKVEWKTGADGTWSVLAWLSANTTSYMVNGLNTINTYYFRIRTYVNSGSYDSLSSELEVSTDIPAAPLNVTISAVSSTQAIIKWADNSDNEEGFRIMRTSGTLLVYVPVGEVGPDAVSYSDRSLLAGVKYTYKVVSWNKNGSSESGIVSISTTAALKVSFKDVTSSISWAKDAIEELAGRGVIKGKTGSLFKPNDTITKAEFTVMIIRAFNLDSAPVGSFADVKANNWFYSEVMIAENLGIVSGDSSNRFYPNRPITREEIAVIICRTLDVAGKPLPGHDNSVLEKFSDRNLISPYSLSSIAALVGEGIMDGISGTISARKTSTRAEAAVFIYRIIDR